MQEREISRRVIRNGPSAGLWIETVSRWICACSATDFYFLPASLSSVATSSSAAHEPFDQSNQEAPETCWRAVVRIPLCSDPYASHETVEDVCIAPDALFHVVAYRCLGNSSWLQEKSTKKWCTMGIPGQLFCFCIGLAPSARRPRCCLLYAADSMSWSSLSDEPTRHLYLSGSPPFQSERTLSTVVARQLMQQEKSLQSMTGSLGSRAIMSNEDSSFGNKSLGPSSSSVGPAGPFFQTKCFDEEVSTLAAGVAATRRQDHLQQVQAGDVAQTISTPSTPESASARLALTAARSISIINAESTVVDNAADVLALTGGARSSPCLPRSRSRGDAPHPPHESAQTVFLICTYIFPPSAAGASASRRNILPAAEPAAYGWQASINVHHTTYSVTNKGLAMSRVKVVENNDAPLSSATPPPATTSRIVYTIGSTSSTASDVQKMMRTSLSNFTRGGAEEANCGNNFANEFAKLLLLDHKFQLPVWLARTGASSSSSTS